MKHILMVTILAASLSGVAGAAGVRHREQRQQNRIAQGVHSGSLTPHEAARLERHEASVQRQIHRDVHDGNGLTRNERAQIQAHENRVSRQIYRAKHNGRVE